MTTHPPTAPATDADTRDLLLRAAGEVFAEAGFHNATVREICRRAGANVAAVNYHFGDKERLYLEVLRYAQTRALEEYPPDLGVPPEAPAAARLRTFVRSLLLRLFDRGPMAWHGKLMAREMIEPTRALDILVKERLRPMAGQLMRIVRELLGPDASEEQVRLCSCSIVSQCVFYHHCRRAICRLFPEQQFEPQDLERLADHITGFSLAALKHVAPPSPAPAKTPTRSKKR